MAADPKFLNENSCDTEETSENAESKNKVQKDLSNEELRATYCDTETEKKLSKEQLPSEEPTQDVELKNSIEVEPRSKIGSEVFNFLKNLLEVNLNKDTEAENMEQISTGRQLQIALQFFINGESQGKAESTADISQALKGLINCLIEVAPQFIKFPDLQEAVNVQQQFFEFGEQKYGTGFPNVLGVVDCTHIYLQPPSMRPEIYLNRHSHHSINIQIVCGPDLQIYNVLAAFPGGMEDACIWQCSSLRQMVSESEVNNRWLLGDLNYPQEPWLMTPLTKPKSPAEKLYNKVHTRTWNSVRGCIGLLKSRFGCLQVVLNYEPRMVCAIITACCVLHNICLHFGDVVEINPALTKVQNVDVNEISIDSMEEGVVTRNDLIKNSFSN